MWNCFHGACSPSTQLSDLTMWNCGESTWGSAANYIHICPHLQHQHPHTSALPSPHPLTFPGWHSICKSDTCLFLHLSRRGEARQGEERFLVFKIPLLILKRIKNTTDNNNNDKSEIINKTTSHSYAQKFKIKSSCSPTDHRTLPTAHNRQKSAMLSIILW